MLCSGPRAVAEKLLRNEIAMEDIAHFQPKTLFEFFRAQSLAMQDQIVKARSVFINLSNSTVRKLFRACTVRDVLHEEAGDMLARRRK